MEKIESDEFDEVEPDVLNKRIKLSERNEDVGTFEKKLKTLLLQNPYTFDKENEGDQKKPGLYQWDDLKSMLHVSDEELNLALKFVSAVEINGYWRIVNDVYMGAVLSHLVQAAKSKPFDGNEVVESLQDIWGLPPVLTRHCLELYASTTDGMVYELDTKRVYVQLARGILKGSGENMEIRTFVYLLRNLVMPLNLDMLDGEFLVEKDGDRAWVFLPSDHNGPNGNNLTSVSQAYTPDPQNPYSFDMPMVESSLNHDVLDDNVKSFLDGTMEQKLEALLLQNPHKLNKQTKGLYQWKDLKSMFHATDEELKSALRLVSAVEINGYWRIVGYFSIDVLLYHLVLEAESNNWCFSSLDGNEVVESLEDNWGFSPVLTRHCLELYASTTDGRVWELDTKRVCVELARGLLKYYGMKMDIQDFMDQLSSIRMPVSLDMLEGEILVEIDGDKAWVHLPSDHDGNTLTSVSQAFPPDSQNLRRFYKPRMKNAVSIYSFVSVVVCEKVKLLPHDDSNQRDKDAGTLEQELKALLLQNLYTLDEVNEGGQKKSGLYLYQWDDLKSRFHATDEELKSALRLVSAVEINGYWRIVDDMCIDQVLYNLLWKADSEDWSFSSLDGNEVVKSLGDTWGFSPVLARHCLELYASTTDGRVWELDTKRVCVELARWVLRSKGKRRMKMEKFVCQWRCVGLPVSLDMLEGEILVEEDGNHSWVSLPSDHYDNRFVR